MYLRSLSCTTLTSTSFPGTRSINTLNFSSKFRNSCFPFSEFKHLVMTSWSWAKQKAKLCISWQNFDTSSQTTDQYMAFKASRLPFLPTSLAVTWTHLARSRTPCIRFLRKSQSVYLNVILSASSPCSTPSVNCFCLWRKIHHDWLIQS